MCNILNRFKSRKEFDRLKMVFCSKTRLAIPLVIQYKKCEFFDFEIRTQRKIIDLVQRGGWQVAVDSLRNFQQSIELEFLYLNLFLKIFLRHRLHRNKGKN